MSAIVIIAMMAVLFGLLIFVAAVVLCLLNKRQTWWDYDRYD